MSVNEIHNIHLANGTTKKRKRKRKNKNIESNITKDEAVSENRHNKKFKFDDDAIPEIKDDEIIPNEDAQDEIETELSTQDSSILSNGKSKSASSEVKYKQFEKLDKVANKQDGKKSPKIVTYQDEGDDEEEEDTYQFSHKSRAQLLELSKQLLETRKKLPIYQHKPKILEYINKNQVTIIIGETGSGKSTQIPQFLIPENKKMIGVTQPRRVAAASLASRVSEEYGCKLGQEVGYQVRFTNTTSLKTKLKYLTDGMLLREIMLDKTLKQYSTIILDEAHERTILTDLIMGFLKSLVSSGYRPDLKIVIMSATLNAELFSKFFNNAPILYIEGKLFPVRQYYLNTEDEDINDVMTKSIIQLNMSEPEGDILCFLPGQEEIDNCVKTLNQLAPDLPKEAPFIVALPLYAALSPLQQSKIFEKVGKNKRKIILATNIAETSITISGIKYVIDSGLRKIKIFKHNLGLSTLLTTPISQASAKQRAGRAGRESEGKVFRLYSESIFNELPKQQESEIKRNDIILPILTLKKLGIDDLLNWTWLEYPGRESILQALQSLYLLNALNDSGKITNLGVKMSILPLQPQLSIVLLTAFELKVLNPVIDIISCLSIDNLILNVTGEKRDEINFKRKQFCPIGNDYGDLIALYEFFKTFKTLGKEWCIDMFFNFKGFKNVMKIKSQLREYMLATVKQDNTLSCDDKNQQLYEMQAQLDSEDDKLNVENVLKSFLKGFLTNTAVGMPDRSYRTFNNGQLISIHPSSTLFGKSLDVIMYIEYVFTTKGYARNVSKIEMTWIQEIAPGIIGKTSIQEKLIE
ncbi:unnamed protein product [Candida verbasci]|uniref:RNA helicase n=1 Tax=Candida verbasci TaxID=1227364 RepID=A0A9W4TZW1_9ASCO|nr:unnamed protein product [Candida verbasci]